MRRFAHGSVGGAWLRLGSLAVGLLVLGACGKTVDTLGFDQALGAGGGAGGDVSTGGRAATGGSAGAGGMAGSGGTAAGLRPLTGPTSYPNAFKDTLGKTDAEINDKIEAAFQRLFYGDPDKEAIYFPIGGGEQAAIRDTYHNDVRTEGIGYGMIICVERNKRAEFDRLWAFAKASLLVDKDGDPKNGYFNSTCDTATDKMACLDPFGHQQFITALLFAWNRWGSVSSHDYEADAQRLLSVMRNKERENGGIVGGVTNMFDEASKLVFDLPDESVGQTTRPSIVMPAYYELWAQATGDDFFKKAAQAGRDYWKVAVNPSTGLIPMRSHFDGTPVSGWNFFGPESYRTQLSMTLDKIWFGSEPWEAEEADRLLAFFASQGMDRYGQSYSLDGKECLAPNCIRDQALQYMNGVTALISSHGQRTAFIQTVWDMEPLSGVFRYYSGLVHLLALLTLSGQYRVY